MRSGRFAELLKLLAEHDVEAIVVGMLAGVLQGAPVTTGDVDIVHRRTPENVARLLDVLAKIGAVYQVIAVLDLRTLIDVKKRAGRPKDLAAIPVLEATLDELEGHE